MTCRCDFLQFGGIVSRCDMMHKTHLQFFKYPEVKNMFCLVFGCGMSHFTHHLSKLFASSLRLVTAQVVVV